MMKAVLRSLGREWVAIVVGALSSVGILLLLSLPESTHPFIVEHPMMFAAAFFVVGAMTTRLGSGRRAQAIPYRGLSAAAVVMIWSTWSFVMGGFPAIFAVPFSVVFASSAFAMMISGGYIAEMRGS